MSKATIDLRHNDEIHIYLSSNVRPEAEHVITFENLPNVTAGALISFTGFQYAIGAGLEVVDDILVWTFAHEDFTEAKTVGKMESISNEGGEYYLIKLTVWRQ